MYSVIIQNQKTMDEFERYQPLFMEAINNDRIGVCKWIESGTTIDTAVPELCNLTNDKEEWRAIIVRFEDESAKEGFETDTQNPYDFIINHDTNREFSETNVPLIRLTHMLGGIPKPELSFRCEQIYEENKAPRTVYKPIVDEKQNEVYERLKKKYKFDGNAPSSILIVTVRNNFVNNEEIGGAWLTHKESESSEFWKTNQYPSICRFVVCDFVDGGPVKRDGDEFNFWISVLLLAINDTDSSTLQAYRLYNLSTEVDNEIMAETFQNLVHKLKSSRFVIEEKIKREAREKLTLDPELPRYRMEIPVSIKLPKDSESLVRKKSFNLFSDGASTDVGIWSNQRHQSEKLLEKALLTAERTLDQTADRMKEFCTFDEDEVSALNRYQTEDLKRETDDIYSDIIKVQGMLPKSKVSEDEELSNSANKVKKYLLGRVMGSAAAYALLIAAIAIIVTVVPALFVSLTETTADIITLITIAFGEIALVLIFAFVTLFVQKGKLNGLIDAYNQNLKSAFNRITNNATEYSRYMSDIVSHSRANSYLNLSKRKKHYSEKTSTLKYKHIKAINLFLERLHLWSKAYYLNVDFDTNYIDEHINVDVSVLPTESKMYTFEFGATYPVEINNSGEYIEAPFAFVKRIEIVREELYDDTNS